MWQGYSKIQVAKLRKSFPKLYKPFPAMDYKNLMLILAKYICFPSCTFIFDYDPYGEVTSFRATQCNHRSE